MKYLSRADEILLLAVLALQENAEGVRLIKEIRKSSGKKLTLGGLWVSLDVLAKKGLVTKEMGDPSPHRGGKSRLYYRLTEEGLAALERVQELNRALWLHYPKSIRTYR
jgi:PadR family transcriptional regulator PadR